MTTWRKVITEPKDGYTNMAIDEAIMIAHRQGKVPPTIRFYRWQPPALSLGYFQQAEKEVDLTSCEKKGIDVVRRLTGGRAILHDKELTYSITVEESAGVLSSSVVESYKQISRGLAAGLQNLNITAVLKPREKQQKAPRGKSSACFDAPSWYEVVVEGKKLIGSAQTRKKGTILQHGSLPFSLDSKKLFELFNFTSEKQREKMRKFYSLKATAIDQCCDRNISFGELTAALARGVTDSLEIELAEAEELSQHEKKLAKELKADKYRSKDWNFKR